ncbi:MAG: restriction endonuclease subunit S [Candidatus Sabulitectum sp.]|nr:restriction endonuclease subunit S [Candidatus Sabulitectum sp.]
MKDKNKNRKGYRKTKVGWIPERWNCSRLENAASVRTGPFGAQLHERDYVDDGTPIVTVEHLSELGIVHRNLPLVSDKDKKRLSRYILKMGDIVFSRVGSVDRNSLVSVREEGWLFSGRLLRVRPNCKYLFPLYVSSVFHRQTFKNHMRNIAVGGTMACLNTALLSRVFIPLPPLPEQKAIASVLECWDKSIQKYEEKIEKKWNIKKGLMQKLLSGEQRLPGFDGEWEKTKISSLAMVLSGGTPSKGNSTFWEGNIPWISSSDLKIDEIDDFKIHRFISEEAVKLSATKIIPANSILVVSRVAVGKVALSKCDICTSQDFQNLVIINNSTNARYLTYQLKRHVRKLTRLNQGTSISGFLKKDLINLPIPLPCLPEQKAIASILSSSDSEIKALERKLALLRDQKKYLLNNLVTGTIRLPEFCKVVG